MLPAMADESKGIMRSLGEFFGHIARGIAADPAASKRGERTVVSEETTEREETTADGQRVILRRTVVEEVEVLPERGVPPASTGSSAKPEERAPQ